MNNTLVDQLINHVAFILDSSGSMSHLRKQVIQVFDGQVKYLSQRSQEVDQETRVSTYIFGSTINCAFYDKDCMRLPSIEKYYIDMGMTKLLGATYRAITDLEKTPQLYGDHAFLIYVLTDGQENSSSFQEKRECIEKIKSLSDNWTMAILVPDSLAAHEAKKFGFFKDNIQIWNVNSSGLVEVEKTIQKTSDSFFTMRASGMRGTKSLFSLNTKNLNPSTIQTNLEEVSPQKYKIFLTPTYSKGTKVIIRDFVNAQLKKGTYVPGEGFYQLTKRETIQASKKICIMDKHNGKVYTGENARDIIGLPHYEVQVDPSFTDKYDIFIQSKSSTRNLMPNTKVLYFI